MEKADLVRIGRTASGYWMALIVLTAASYPAAAANCNFDKPTGSCTPRIEFRTTKGSHRSYSADIIVHSSAQTCSKVEYHVENTPYTTVLSATDAEPESLSSSAPIEKRMVQIDRCTTYEDSDDASPENTGQAGDQASVAGHWITGQTQLSNDFTILSGTMDILPDGSTVLDIARRTNDAPDMSFHRTGTCRLNGKVISCRMSGGTSRDASGKQWTYGGSDVQYTLLNSTSLRRSDGVIFNRK